MIAHLRGKIIDKEDDFIVIEVAGVGYKVFGTEKTRISSTLDKETAYWIYQVVREDTLTLYGFENKKDLQVFELLLSVSGIGPKSALAILNIASAEALGSAIASGDASHLSKTTGIGLKKAEKIVLELKDKFELVEGELEGHKETADVIDALVTLGYSKKEAQEIIKKIPAEAVSTEAKIKEALKRLGS